MSSVTNAVNQESAEKKSNLVAFTARLPKKTHADLKEYAAENDVTINTALVAILKWALAMAIDNGYPLTTEVKTKKIRQVKSDQKLINENSLPGEEKIQALTMENPAQIVLQEPDEKAYVDNLLKEFREFYEICILPDTKSRKHAYMQAKDENVPYPQNEKDQDKIYDIAETIRIVDTPHG